MTRKQDILWGLTRTAIYKEITWGGSLPILIRGGPALKSNPVHPLVHYFDRKDTLLNNCYWIQVPFSHTYLRALHQAFLNPWKDVNEQYRGRTSSIIRTNVDQKREKGRAGSTPARGVKAEIPTNVKNPRENGTNKVECCFCC